MDPIARAGTCIQRCIRLHKAFSLKLIDRSDGIDYDSSDPKPAILSQNTALRRGAEGMEISLLQIEI